ncbi:MAG: chromosome segregation protein SMC [Nitrososphaerota archaeon]|jgi:chromosome segregation protein|nr:chromosome segregation protein SMC [Nitrososphaerota archaeon]
MPYIKKIELKGFKSFGPQTIKVNLDKGFTAITGPNGSGKTNIMDALLFSLGELSTKRLRAENSAKLIFHGSEKGGLEKAKMAKVVVQFDNTDGLMPVDTTTITISREVYRNGQSVYRLNGRRMSRTHITETLSMAAISSMSQNIIPQGTITRLTDLTAPERRKIIEDLIGIAQYDSEKTEAEEKLRAADISIRTAMGRIDEVQKRLDDLERERNQLLRYNFIQTETRKFQAVRISSDITQQNQKVAENTVQTQKVQSRVDKLKEQRDLRRNRRHEIEGEWRKLSGEGLEQGGSEVLRIQIKIGELKSKLTELNSKINSGQASLDSFKRVRENNVAQHESLQKEIHENRLKIRQFRSELEKLKIQLTEKQVQHETLAKETAQLWAGLDGNNQQIHKFNGEIEGYVKRLAFLRSEYKQDKTALRLCVGRIKNLTARKEKFIQSQAEIEKSLAELEQVQRDQKAQLRNLENTIERKNLQRDTVSKEILEAEKIASSAKDAVIEFATQRNLAATIAAEEKALRSIEEMGKVGAINGIHGRLRELVKIDKSYKKAIDAAATGWMDALIVKDIDTAFTCTETLRRMKLGRIKIIPMQGAINPKNKPAPKRDGIMGPLSGFMKYSGNFDFAVNYVFGDTVVATNDKTAFALSNEGFRVVTINGDLYEPGAFESGYYRAPIDFSTIIPSENALKSLDEAVRALQTHLTQRSTDIVDIEEELEHAKTDMIRLAEGIATLEREIIRIRRGVKRTQFNIRHIDKYGGKLEREAAAFKGRMTVYRNERSNIQAGLKRIHTEIAALRLKTDVEHIKELEVQREKFGEEANTLRQRIGSLQTEINTNQSQFDHVLRISYKNTKIQLTKMDQQQAKLQREVTDAIAERDVAKKEVDELEKNRVELSKVLLSAREESQKFTSQIDSIDAELRLLDVEYDQADRLRNQLQLSMETAQMRLQQLQAQLKQYGYEQSLEVNERQVQDAETTIRMMQFEMDRIGAVNQLAAQHYADQISRYRELSVRLNELEREKQAIVAFMDEIEAKKRKVFMTAFDKINASLTVYFSKMTGGGEATLRLENPDDPFTGGIEMIVQFPNKPAIVVSGASGGERSISAVAFIFSLKEFSPASFYILDEVDAHLDAFHTTKLAETLLEEAGKTQFIVISLRPEMVNKAQKVYGVYERNGISNVVTAKFPAEVPAQ